MQIAVSMPAMAQKDSPLVEAMLVMSIVATTLSFFVLVFLIPNKNGVIVADFLPSNATFLSLTGTIFAAGLFMKAFRIGESYDRTDIDFGQKVMFIALLPLALMACGFVAHGTWFGLGVATVAAPFLTFIGCGVYAYLGQEEPGSEVKMMAVGVTALGALVSTAWAWIFLEGFLR